MVLFAVEDDGDHFPDYKQPDDEEFFLDEQSDQEDDIYMDDDDDDYSSPDEQSDREDDDVSMAAATADARYHQPGHGDLFTELLTEAIRSYTDRGFHSHAGTFSEFFYFLVLVRLRASRRRRRSRMFQAADEYSVEEDADIEEDNPAPAHAPPPAASEAAIAALEAAEAPADDCCPVCLQEEDGAWRRVAPCGHRFHAACVARWLRVKLSCPVCRRDNDGAAAEPSRRPLPAIVEEALAMSYEEFVVFERSARWLEFMATVRFQSTENSSGVSTGAA